MDDGRYIPSGSIGSTFSYQLIVLNIISSNTGQPAVPVAALDMNMLEFDESD